MSKNMTRKGLALGSALALAITGFTALPASANGINDGSVSLLPNAGDEYNMIAGGALELKSNMATGVTQSGRYLKFRVEDPNRDMSVVSGQYTAVPTAAAVTAASGIVTLTVPNHLFKQGDKVSVSGVSVVSAGTATAATPNPQGGASDKETVTITIANGWSVGDTITVANAATSNVVYTVTAANVAAANPANSVAAGLLAAITGATGAAYENNSSSGAAVNLVALAVGTRTDITATVAKVNLAAAVDAEISAVTAGGSGTIVVPTTAATSANIASGTLSSELVTISTTGNRAANGTFVVDTKVATNTADKVLRLRSADKDATQTAVVTAWVDSNDNGLIDTTEYASPARTLNFLASSAITPTVTILPAFVGQSTVQATVTFSPVLNGAQLVSAVNLGSVAAAVQVNFTRPGSATTQAAATVEYSNTTKTFTATSVNMNSGWGITQPAASTNLTSTATITRNVATVITSAAHGLQVGDRVVISGATTSRLNSPTSGTAGLYSTVLSIPTTTSFTYAEQNADGTAATGADLTATTQSAGTVRTDTGEARVLRNFVVTGEYTARAQLFRYIVGTDALTNISPVVRATVGATTAASAAFAGVPSANTNLAGQVRVGTTSTSAVLTVRNEDGDPVGAGVNVSMTAQRTAGTSVVTVNGTSVGASVVNLSGVTDANGRVTVSITNATGAVGDVVRLTANAQGSTTGNFDVTWQNAIYSIVDLKDQSAVGSPARNRAADANGAYAFDLLVIDQFKSPAPATVRLLATVSGRTTSTTPVTLTNGRATVNIVPDGSAVTGSTTVEMDFQTQDTATGLWTTVGSGTLDDRYIDWEAGEAGTVAINFYSQTDRVTLNANGANLPSSTTAVRTANVTTKALKAVDLRTANDTAETYPTGTRAVVSGSVTNSVTGVAKAGGVVTISGTGLLFKVGDVWALNTLTFITNDGTFAVDVYSRVSGQQTVTVASGSVTSTAVLTFNAVGGATATGLTVNLVTPATAGPGTTFQVQGQVRDANGNPIVISTAGTGANPTLTVTYNGPGLVSGALPTTTNATGTFSFFVLLGSNDRGTATVTATYDADGTGTAAAAISKTNTITVGAGPVGTGKVNVGSFNGKLVVYAANLNGKRISWKVGGNWGSAVASSNYAVFNRPTPRAGVTVSVDIYVDGVKTLTKSVVTR